MKLIVRFGYPTKLRRKGSETLHDMFCSKLDSNGEGTHNSLSECLASVIKDLTENNVFSWVKVQ
jgi:hypothetical protein